MRFTVRFAHLEDFPGLKKGDTVYKNTTVGKMGNTGQSTGSHLHIDCVRQFQTHPWSLYDMEHRVVEPAERELNYFIDDELFGVTPIITTYYNDVDYFYEYGKVHCGYDVVPIDRKETDEHFYIKWNRSVPGQVLLVDYNSSYGNFVLIGYEK